MLLRFLVPICGFCQSDAIARLRGRKQGTTLCEAKFLQRLCLTHRISATVFGACYVHELTVKPKVKWPRLFHPKKIYPPINLKP